MVVESPADEKDLAHDELALDKDGPEVLSSFMAKILQAYNAASNTSAFHQCVSSMMFTTSQQSTSR